MSKLHVRFSELKPILIEKTPGTIAFVAARDGQAKLPVQKTPKAFRDQLEVILASQPFEELEPGEVMRVDYPQGLEAERLVIGKLAQKYDDTDARKLGAKLRAASGKGQFSIVVRRQKHLEDIVMGAALRSYEFNKHKTKDVTDDPNDRAINVYSNEHEEVALAYHELDAVVKGVHATRDLVNEPANALTTTAFADRLRGLTQLGLKVKVLEEAEMQRLGMGSLLSVGQGSASPSYLVAMEWMGGDEADAPLAVVGKGVVFDTGGISLKPAAGMEDMTMDMGGAGVVAGLMETLARREAKANVVGIVGLVENMPSGTATRPGDIVTSMKGETIEVINTDAEGRLVLADALWYAQQTYYPSAIVDLATLTGAVIIALGHENTGVFSNDAEFAGDILAAAAAEGEGAWQLPLSPAYDKLLKSDKADMKNVGGREAGSITAAQFLQRFIKEDMPWCHLDIAGTAQTSKPSAYAPKGATGWGVMTLNRLVRDRFERATGNDEKA